MSERALGRCLIAALLACAPLCMGHGCCTTGEVTLEGGIDAARATTEPMAPGQRVEVLTPAFVVTGSGYRADELWGAEVGDTIGDGARVVARSDGEAPVEVEVPADGGPLIFVRTDATQPIHVRTSVVMSYCESGPFTLLPLSALEGECGDGFLDPGEACDDANAESGDGCDACALEPAVCRADGSYRLTTCDALGCTAHECPDAADPACAARASLTASAIVEGRSLPADPTSTISGAGLSCSCREDALVGRCDGACESDALPCDEVLLEGPDASGIDGLCPDATSCEIGDTRERALVGRFDAGASGVLETVALGGAGVGFPTVRGAGDHLVLSSYGQGTIAGLRAAEYGYAIWGVGVDGTGRFVRELPAAPVFDVRSDGSSVAALVLNAPFDFGAGEIVATLPGRLVVVGLALDGATSWIFAPEPTDGERVLPLAALVHEDGTTSVVQSVATDAESRAELLVIGADGSLDARSVLARGGPTATTRLDLAATPDGGLLIVGFGDLGPFEARDTPVAWTLRTDRAGAMTDATVIEDVPPASIGWLRASVSADGTSAFAWSGLASTDQVMEVLRLDARGAPLSRTARSPLHPCPSWPSAAVVALDGGGYAVAADACPLDTRHTLLSAFDAGDDALFTERVPSTSAALHVHARGAGELVLVHAAQSAAGLVVRRVER